MPGSPGGSSYWSRTGTTLSPATAGDVITQGTYDSSSDSGVGAYIGSGSIIGQQALGASSTAPVFQVRRGSGAPTINLRSAGEADFASDVKIIGTGTLAAPNISLNADGSISTPFFISANSGAFAFKRPDENQQVSMNSGTVSYSMPKSAAIQGLNTSTNRNYFAVDYDAQRSLVMTAAITPTSP